MSERGCGGRAGKIAVIIQTEDTRLITAELTQLSVGDDASSKGANNLFPTRRSKIRHKLACLFLKWAYRAEPNALNAPDLLSLLIESIKGLSLGNGLTKINPLDCYVAGENLYVPIKDKTYIRIQQVSGNEEEPLWGLQRRGK